MNEYQQALLRIIELEDKNAALRRGIAKHAEYDWEGNPINWCAVLLTKEQEDAAERSIDEIVEALENIARLAANTGNMPEYEDALNILFTIGGVAVKAIHKAKE